MRIFQLTTNKTYAYIYEWRHFAFCQVPYPDGYRCFVQKPNVLRDHFGKYVVNSSNVYTAQNAARKYYLRIIDGLIKRGYEKSRICNAYRGSIQAQLTYLQSRIAIFQVHM